MPTKGFVNFRNKGALCVDGYKINGTLVEGDISGELLNDWRIFIDENGNKTFDFGEPNATTGSDEDGFPDGYWRICGLEPGVYDICEENQTGWFAIDPDDGCNESVPVPAEGFVNFSNGLPIRPPEETVCISGYKFDAFTRELLNDWTIFVDLNNSGTLDTGEPNATTWF